MLIPKQMFYIWFGDNIPNYTNIVINQFKELHPDYKVDLIHYNVEELNDVQKTKDKLLIKADEYVVKKSQNYLNGKRSYIIEMADIYRSLLIDEYGGFFSDLDIFMIRKIPEKFLTFQKVSCTIMYNPYVLYKEISWFGSYKYSDRKKYATEIYTIPFGGYIQNDNDSYYLERKRKFFNGTLTNEDYDKFRMIEGIQKYQIAEHFAAHSWHNTQLTNKDIYIKR